MHPKFQIKDLSTSPSQFGSVDKASTLELKDPRFHSQSRACALAAGSTPGLDQGACGRQPIDVSHIDVCVSPKIKKIPRVKINKKYKIKRISPSLARMT